MKQTTKLPAAMTAIAITEPGGPMVLKPEKRPLPLPGPGEILIRVRAAGVNRPDVLQRQGAYPPPPGASDLPGLEVAGEVAALGDGVKRWRAGDPVTALTPGGGYAEFCLVDESNALPVPHGFTFTEAAAVPETFFTVWHNVFQRGGLKAGETFLVHGGTSGIGTAAIQLAKAFGARVIATAGSAEKCEACTNLGADRTVNYRSEDFVAAVKETTGGKGADVILDMVGGDYYARNVELLNLRGRIVFIATLGGSHTEIEIGALMRKRARLIGSVLRSRSLDEKVDIREKFMGRFWPQLEAGAITPVIDRVYPIAETEAAHARMAANENIGKIVLKVR
jgi:putative PIG3 family NAD(P)H quinone oxidoreductase